MTSLRLDEDSDYEENIEETVDLDTSWINEFEKVDKDYASFYLEDLSYMKVTILYINNSNEIEKIKEEKIIMSKPNCISREEIIGILKRNSVNKDKKFTIMTMLKYNLDLEPVDVRNFLLTNRNDSSYLSVIKDVDEIYLNRSISMFQDLNNLIIIFYENEKIEKQKKTENGKTKRIYFTSTPSLSSHNKTLKIKLKTI
jgi:hypothetical protein